ncbi:MAG: DUF4290 domain-containing protein [Muribaculum sp.]|nr:DUF4290 domain-containing protein [Muribaculum sp.]
MLTYNTQQKKILLPEYGRNIQSMVEHCLTIEDREERTRCAYSIVASMGNLFPQLRDNPEYKHKLWDHLAIMSDFSLDIDYPYDVVQKETLDIKPEVILYPQQPIRWRHYGACIEHMIGRAVEMPESPERDALVLMLANHMKKVILNVNPEGVDDERIFKDLAAYSHGAIRLSSENVKLYDFKPETPVVTGKKKRKKK